MIINEKQLQEILEQNTIVKKEEYNNLKEKKQFVLDFNIEAKRQNNEWFAEVQSKKYHLLHICKVKKFWFIIIEKISLFVSFSDGYFRFVDNDYAFDDYSEKQNEEVLNYLKEFKSVLEKIPQKFFYFTNYSMIDFEKRMKDIEERIGNIEKT